MARERLPGRFAIALTVFHSISLVACLAAFVAACYATAHTQLSKAYMVGTLVASLWTIGEDLAELAALADKQRARGVRRCPAKFLWLLELVTAVFCFALPFASAFAVEEMNYNKCRYIPYNDWDKYRCGSVDNSVLADRGQMAAYGAIYLAAYVFVSSPNPLICLYANDSSTTRTVHSILFVMTAIHLCVKKRKGKGAPAAATV